HGVMNTDNMLISGESIDFGPCAFLDGFDPAAVYSSIDTGGRYAFANQPAVAQWNLARFAEALLPLLAADQQDAVALATQALGNFAPAYGVAWAAGLRRKLGLPNGVEDELLGQLQRSAVDYTSFFRDLAAAARGDVEPVRGRFLDITAFDAWLARWRALGPDAAAMDRANPVYIPRNHLVEQALGSATAGDLGPLTGLLEAVSAPYHPRPGFERYAE